MSASVEASGKASECPCHGSTQAGIGAPDGTDVAGRIGSLAEGREVLRQTLISLLPAAVAHEVTTHDDAEALLEALDRDVVSSSDHSCSGHC